jgi:hypothetical protein
VLAFALVCDDEQGLLLARQRGHMLDKVAQAVHLCCQLNMIELARSNRAGVAEKLWQGNRTGKQQQT